MNRLRNIVGLIAVCATAAFFTGCGDDDHTDNGGNQPNAPASLNGRTYNLADAGGTTVIAFDQNANYTLTPSNGGAAETGTATSNQSGDVWTSSLVATGAATNSTLTLTFTAPGTGTYTFDRPGEPLVSGNFQEAGVPNPTTDGGGTTDGGTNGNVTPPATLNALTVTTADSGIGSGAVYTVNLDQTGHFTAIDQGGQQTGSGTFTYTPNNANDTAHLVLNYDAPAGDQDDMNLIFTTQPGGGASNFTGSQIVSGANHNFTGTFTY